MTPIKKETAFPSLSDFFELDSWLAPERFLKNFQSFMPATNVFETENEYKVELAIPGFKKEDVKIKLENNVLTISAENKEEKSQTDKKFTRKEFSYNSFSRSFSLPEAANNDKIEAKYENGLLKLDIAKKEGSASSNKKEIKIN